MIILEIFLASIILWVMFIMVCTMRPHLKHDHGPLIDIPILLFSFIFVVIDAVFNITYGSIVFAELPREWMLTHRLRRILTNTTDTGWRFKLAMFVCSKMIEPWDWNHCGLKK